MKYDIDERELRKLAEDYARRVHDHPVNVYPDPRIVDAYYRGMLEGMGRGLELASKVYHEQEPSHE